MPANKPSPAAKLKRCGFFAGLLALVVLAITAPAAAAGDALTIYTAREIITMDPSLPQASAVATMNGHIVAVGDVDSMSAWTSTHDYVVDDRFTDKVLVPGFIDNHLHPFLAAIILNTTWITPHEWRLTGLVVPATQTPADYLDRVRNAIAMDPDSTEPFITWGYHELWHGPLRRNDLDAISDSRPIILWQRSFHEIIVNTPALEWLNFDSETDEAPIDSDFDTGVFSERGLMAAVARLTPYFFTPERLGYGLDRLREIAHHGGITTLADMGVGMYLGLEQEMSLLGQAYDNEATPFRLMLIPLASALTGMDSDDVDALLGGPSTERIRLDKHVKLLADGGFFAQYMRMNFPGYTDGHEGKWLMKPEQLYRVAETFWNRGYQLHVHVNGDEGMDVTLGILNRLLDKKPRFDHRFTLHHVGFATNDQLRRAARLGVVISAQPNYIWALGDKYAEHGLGADRASQMSRIGAMVRNGIPTSLHSDFTMAPAAPLTLAWIAANRITAEGTRMAPVERISVDEALRAITIDAAFALGLEQEIGSIVAGKRADFTVLEKNPFKVDAKRLRDIPVWGTVFAGRAYPLEKY